MFLAVGDINLGRRVGLKIIAGDTSYPFRRVSSVLKAYDIVFGNLESQLSDQGEETESPQSNMVFTGPPGGAWSLRTGGVSCVSLANNHMGDYGREALRQTLENLDSAEVAHVGAATNGQDPYRPLLLERRSIHFALFACTDIMPGSGSGWERFIAQADTGRLFPRLREVRPLVDFVIVSYHGGVEYADSAGAGVQTFFRAALAQGADLVVGHHPHVPYGIEELEGRYMVYSLGNFVFAQSTPEWTKYSFAFAAQIVKDSDSTRIHAIRILPLRSRLQPEFLGPGAEADSVFARLQAHSSLPPWLVAGPAHRPGGF